MCSDSASAPANGPMPAASTISAAHTSSGTLRRKLSTKRAPWRSGPPMRPEAGSASTAPATAASTVPSADTASVCSAPWPTLARNSGDTSGGKNSAMNLPMSLSDSAEPSAP
ncbi:hypothetical protein D9M69_594490 [compost metagenome]